LVRGDAIAFTGGLPIPFSIIFQAVIFAPTGAIELTNSVHLSVQ